MDKKYKRGFTWMEFFVVIAIVSILALIVLGYLNSVQQQGNDDAKIADVQQTEKALQLYITDNAYYPSGSTNAALAAALVPKYIPSIDPAIRYQSTNMDNTACSSDCPSYHIGIPLGSSDNQVLRFDKDLNSDGTVNGQSDDCVSAGKGPSVPDLCYDETPY